MSVRPVNVMPREYVIIREYKMLRIIFGVETYEVRSNDQVPHETGAARIKRTTGKGRIVTAASAINK